MKEGEKFSLEDLSKDGFLEKLEKLKRKEPLKGRAVCFIPQWEVSGLDSLTKITDKEAPYILKEKEFMKTVKGLFDLFGHLSFVVYQKEEGGEILFSIYDKNEERLSRENFFYSRYFISVLCIDYDKFDSSVLYEFINYMLLVENEKEIDFLGSLAELFRFTSKSVRWLSYGQIILIINRYFKSKSLDSGRWSEIDFLANNSMEFIEKSPVLKEIGTEGYLCSENDGENKTNNSIFKEGDVRFFYSFESLLFYELKELFLKVNRCRNCGNVLPEGYKGKNCPDNKECLRERGRIRQKKFKENLENF